MLPHRRRALGLAPVGLFVALATSPLHAQCERADLAPSDGLAGDEFGSAVALDGSWAAVGAPNADRGGTDRGAVYVYERDGLGGWVERQVLVPSDPADFDRFGWSVALEGDLLLVGVLSDDDLGFDSGSAYLFEHDGTAWVETQKLLASNGGLGDLFGISVAISDGRLVVGACQRSLFELFGIGEGMVYLFEHDGSAYVQTDVLTASDRQVGDFFGAAVAVDGDRVVIGAEAEDQAGTDAGAVYVFDRLGASWSERAKLTASDGAAGDFFGMRVAVDGERLAVCAPTADVAGVVDAGAAYVFDGTAGGASWTEVYALVAAAPDQDDQLGLGLALEGDLVVVGAPGGGAGDEGEVVMLRDDGPLAVVASLAGDLAGDEFGWSCALDGDAVLVGARAAGAAGAARELLHVEASALARGAAPNPDSLMLPPPRLGTTVVATVDLAGTTGHPLAGLVGFAQPTQLTLPGGQVLLVDPSSPGGELLGLPVMGGPSASFSLPVPDDPATCGAALSVQALHLGGGQPFALSNAQDAVVGS